MDRLYTICPILHPGFIIRGGWAWRGLVARDLARIRAEAYGEGFKRLETAYTPEWRPYLPPSPDPDKPFVSDLETIKFTTKITQLNWSQMAGQGVAGRWDEEMAEWARREYDNPRRVYVFHNAPFDVGQLHANGIEVKGKLYDTMVATAILEPDLPNSLEHVTKDYAPDIEPWKHEAQSDLMLYGCKDADATQRVYEGSLAELKQEGAYGVFETSMEVLPLLIEMNRYGLKIDQEKAEEAKVGLKEQEDAATQDLNLEVRGLRSGRINDAVEGLERVRVAEAATGRERIQQRKAFREAAGRLHDLVLPNWNSPDQLLEVLDEMGLPRRRNKDGKVTTDAAALQELARQFQKPILLKLIALREANKLRTTFFDQDTDGDQRIHPAYLMHRDYDDDLDSIEGACSGRLASKGPNIQNWPKRARGIVVPDSEDQECIAADYRQIEFRVIAWKTGGKLWEDVNRPGFDVHKVVAAEVYGVRLSEVTDEQRQRGKSCNYAAVYGVGALTLSRQLAKKGIFLTVADCKRFIATFNRLYPQVAQMRQAWVREAFATNKVTNPFGRFRRFYKPNDEATAIFNIYPQGTAGDIMLRAMAKLRRALPRSARVAIQVHDDLVVFGPKWMRQEILECLTDVMTATIPEMPGFTTPIDLRVGSSWGSLNGVQAA
jgi:DNA polymerase-1